MADSEVAGINESGDANGTGAGVFVPTLRRPRSKSPGTGMRNLSPYTRHLMMMGKLRRTPPIPENEVVRDMAEAAKARRNSPKVAVGAGGGQGSPGAVKRRSPVRHENFTRDLNERESRAKAADGEEKII